MTKPGPSSTSSGTKLAFVHVGPAKERAIAVPPFGVTPAAYFLCFDEDKRQIVYGTSPGYHQVGHVWRFDGAAWQQASSSTYRVSSQRQPWRGLWDPRRRAIVAWGWDTSAGPVGVVHRDGGLEVILHERSAERLKSMQQSPRVDVVTGDLPAVDSAERSAAVDGATWDTLSALFAIDRARAVTVCLTQAGLWELDAATRGARWSKKDGVDVGLVPAQVEAEALYARSAGAGGVYDAPRKRVLFWMHDRERDALALLTWDGRALKKLAARGLPDDLLDGFDVGCALGPHPEHGLVLYAGPRHGLFGLGDDGETFVRVDGGSSPESAPPRGKAGQLAYDEERSLLVLGPQSVAHSPQASFFVRDREGSWTRQGASTTKSPLASLSSGFIGWGRAGAERAMHAASFYLKTAAWTESAGWRVVVDEKAGDDARNGARAIAFTTAWDDDLHAVMNDGSVFAFDGAWKKRAGPSELFKKVSFPLVAFDRERRLLVAWGPDKAKGGRKDETFVFDGNSWTKAKKSNKAAGLAERSAAADTDDTGAVFDVFFDPGRAAVMRLGRTDLARFDGKAWIAEPLDGGEHLDGWRRVVCPHPERGPIVVVNIGARSVVRIEGARVVPVGTFDPPVKRDDNCAAEASAENVPFDRWWFDDTSLRLVTHADADDKESWALDLKGAFEA